MGREYLEEGFGKLAKFTIKFAIENNLKFIFASKRKEGSEKSQIELDFYKKYLDKNEYNYLLNNLTKKKISMLPLTFYFKAQSQLDANQHC